MMCFFPVQAMKLILLKLGPITEEEIELPWVTVGEAFEQMIRSAVLHIHKEHFDIVFKCLEVHWFFFYYYVFFFLNSWETEKHSAFIKKSICVLLDQNWYFFCFGKFKYSIMCMGKIPLFFWKFTVALVAVLRCEKGTAVCKTWSSVPCLGKEVL